MSRKNYNSRSARRAHGVTRPVLATDLLDTVTDLYRVLVVNGVASRQEELYGTAESVRWYAEQCALRGAYGPGVWHVSRVTATGKVQGAPQPYLALV